MFGGFEMNDGPMVSVVFPHTTLAVGGRHVDMRYVHNSVLGCLMHSHGLLVVQTVLALRACPIFLYGWQANFKPY